MGNVNLLLWSWKKLWRWRSLWLEHNFNWLYWPPRKVLQRFQKYGSWVSWGRISQKHECSKIVNWTEKWKSWCSSSNAANETCYSEKNDKHFCSFWLTWMLSNLCRYIFTLRISRNASLSFKTHNPLRMFLGICYFPHSKQQAGCMPDL